MSFRPYSPGEFARDKRSSQRWKDEARNDDLDVQLNDTQAALSQVLVFLADGLTLGNFSQRALALLFVIRPELLHGQTYSTLERELRLKSGTIGRAVSSLHDEFPDLLAYHGNYSQTRQRRVLRGQYRRTLVRLRQVRQQEREGELAKLIRERIARWKAIRAMQRIERKMGRLPPSP